jgi:hypothetical protein
MKKLISLLFLSSILTKEEEGEEEAPKKKVDQGHYFNRVPSKDKNLDVMAKEG